jgi:hypothetical protein
VPNESKITWGCAWENAEMIRNTVGLVALFMACAIAVADSQVTLAQEPTKPEVEKQLPLRPHQPSGFLTDTLGTYVTIEGTLYEGSGKVESNSLVVDTVDDRKLQHPILVKVKNVRLPARIRCVLKGYELGEMIGRPPAEYAIAKELGRDPEELARRDAVSWQWRPYFVPLIAVEPKGLKLSTPWGITR